MSEIYDKKDWYSKSDGAILNVLAAFIKKVRLKKNHTKFDLAAKAGIHRVTLSEFEKGKRGSLTTFIQLLRALEELEMFDTFIIPTTLSPLQMAKLEAKKRKRASPNKTKRSVKNKKLLKGSKSRGVLKIQISRRTKN